MKSLLEQLLHVRPFRMIRVILRSGGLLDIVSPFQVAMGWRRATVITIGDRVAQLAYEEIEVAYHPRSVR